MPALGRMPGQDVEADRMGEVGRIEVAEIVGAPGRDAIEQRLGQIAVGVEQRCPLPRLDVLQDHRLEQRRLAGAALPQRVEMLAPVGAADAERHRGAAPPAQTLAQQDDVVVVIHAACGGSPPRSRALERTRPAVPAARRSGPASLRDAPCLPRSRRPGAASGWLCARPFMDCRRQPKPQSNSFISIAPIALNEEFLSIKQPY